MYLDFFAGEKSAGIARAVGQPAHIIRGLLLEDFQWLFRVIQQQIARLTDPFFGGAMAEIHFNLLRILRELQEDPVRMCREFLRMLRLCDYNNRVALSLLLQDWGVEEEQADQLVRDRFGPQIDPFEEAFDARDAAAAAAAAAGPGVICEHCRRREAVGIFRVGPHFQIAFCEMCWPRGPDDL